MGHNFSILTDKKSKSDPATQKFYLYLSLMSKHETTPLLTLNCLG